MISSFRIRVPKISIRVAASLLLLISITLSACVADQTPQPILENRPAPTSTTSPTPTVDWFPATATPTMMPTIGITPTAQETQVLGSIIFTDNFTQPELWSLGPTASGNVSLGVNELTIALAEPGAYEYSVRSTPILGDFHLEITSFPTLCHGEDQYGLLLRMSSPGNFYRFAESCDGRVRLDRILGGNATSPQPWIQNNSVPPGALIPSRLGVWLSGEEMRFYINGQHQFTVLDPALQSGNIGLFARSLGDNAVTVNFSDLVVRQVNQ